MADVGVRELKQRLSEYLDRAERGEVLRVTDRGRPKAVLGPLPGRARIGEGDCRRLDLAAGTGEPLRDVAPLAGAGAVLDALSEDREK